MKYRHHIGMDAHSRSSTFAVMDNRGRVVQRAVVTTCETELLGFIRSLRGPCPPPHPALAVSSCTRKPMS